MTLTDAIAIAQSGLSEWAGKPHNARWWRRIDGTPIPNDLVICIAEAFAATAPAEPGWQPISSAPRDGTTILVAHSSNGAMFTVNWDDGAAGWVNGETDNYDDLVTYSPSHWRPLPTPPVEAPTPAHAELSPGNSSDLRGEES